MLRIDFKYWRDNGQLKATSAGLRGVLAFAYANGPAAGGSGCAFAAPGDSSE